MKKLILLLVLSSSAAFATSANVPVEVKSKVVANVQEVTEMNKAYVSSVQFVFDQDFGYGTQIGAYMPHDPYMDDPASVANWVCGHFGYFMAISVTGKADFAKGTPLMSFNGDLAVTTLAYDSELGDTIVCQIK